MKKIKNDNRGMIIVFTLIMLAVFLTTALSFSYFIIRDINKAKSIDNSIIAYYSADAGMEESLYLLKNQELAESVESLKSKRPSPIEMTLSKGAWDISSSTSYETSVLRQRLYNGQSAKFFILNRGALTGQNTTKSITLEWHKSGGIPKLQASMTQLTSQFDNNGSLIYFTDRSELEVDDTLVKCFDLKDRDFSGAVLSPLPDYLIEYKVLGENNEDFIDTLRVKTYSIACDPNPDTMAAAFNSNGITNPTVKSSGTYGRSTQSIIAHILPKDPVSGLLGFVLFSEQDVTKE
ncbi:MAG: hypothetical protein WCT26_01310 [Candidatus Buchananbacteria bacterium]